LYTRNPARPTVNSFRPRLCPATYSGNFVCDIGFQKNPWNFELARNVLYPQCQSKMEAVEVIGRESHQEKGVAA
jgi:hypothetical protein